MNFTPERIVNQELLDGIRNLPCLACASLDPEAAYEAIHDNEIRCHPHHVLTRGAGGNDVAQNLMPLCLNHHQEIHRIGLVTFADKYQTAATWLILAGWEKKIWNEGPDERTRRAWVSPAVARSNQSYGTAIRDKDGYE